MAQGVFEAAARREGLVDEISVDSAGTQADFVREMCKVYLDTVRQQLQ